jgi:cytochrome c-type biogenesis protein CcmE
MTEEIPPVSSVPAEEEGVGLPAWLKVCGVLVFLLAGVGFLLMGSGGDAFVYSKLVSEVVGHEASLDGQQLRVEGLLTQGSVRFREDPCEWRFSLEKEGVVMPVRFSECVVPDTFRDNMGITVTVQGQVEPNGTFIASEVVPRCPSKYEEARERGESSPHAAASAAPPPPIEDEPGT